LQFTIFMNDTNTMSVLSRINRLLLLLVPFVQAQDCFCPGGASVPDPDKVVQLSPTVNATCGDLQKDASKRYLVQTYGCNYYLYYAHLCGCEERQNSIEKCQMCTDNIASPVEVQRSAANSNQCDDYAIQAKYDPFRMGCGYYNYLGSECACTKNRPPYDGCSLCADGSNVPQASKEVGLGIPGLEQGTCDKVDDFIRYVYETGTGACTSRQATLGSYCGCVGESQPEGACPLCTEEGMAISNDPAPKFNYLSHNGETQIYQSGKSCLEAELIAHEMTLTGQGEKTCSSLREQLSAVCCRLDSRLPVNRLNNTQVSTGLPSGATYVLESVTAVASVLLAILQLM
jgi:hypothetical protein